MQVRRRHRRLPQRRHELRSDVVDLDRGEAQTLDAVDRACLADESGERVARASVAEAAEVDAGEHDFAVPLGGAAPNLGEHRGSVAAAGRAADERDHAEVARERAAVLDLHERPHTIEPMLRPDAADRADVARDRVCRLFARPCDDGHVAGEPVEPRTGKAGGATRHEHTRVGARRPRYGLARLRHGLVGHAAGVHDGDVGAGLGLDVPVREQAFTDRLRVGERDLAAEEARRERRHGPRELRRLCAADGLQPNRRARAGRPSSSAGSRVVRQPDTRRSPPRARRAARATRSRCRARY